MNLFVLKTWLQAKFSNDERGASYFVTQPPEEAQPKKKQQREIRRLDTKGDRSPKKRYAVAAPVAKADEVQCHDNCAHQDHGEDRLREPQRQQSEGRKEDGDRRRIFACWIQMK